MISVDGGQETYRRISAADSTLMATYAIPFEAMGRRATTAIEAMVVNKQSAASIATGPYLFFGADLVDQSNVAQYLTP